MVLAGFYYENFKTYFNVKPNEDGVCVLRLPVEENRYIAGFTVSDTGMVVVGALEDPEKFIGRKIPMVGDNLHPQEYCELMTKYTGEKWKFEYIKGAEMEKSGMPMAKEMSHMFQWISECGAFGKMDIDTPRKEFNFTTFEEYLKKQK